jgi:hypothetical protein
MNENTLSLIGLFVLGAVIGFGVVSLYINWRVRRFIKRIDEVIGGALEEAHSKLVPLLVEKDHDTFYCYTETDKQFICQGKTADEIKEALKVALPDKMPYIGDSTNPEILEELKTSLTEVEVPAKTA